MKNKALDEIPYFIQIRGCINCEASKLMRERHGRDYGVDHEILVVCVLRGCYRLSPIFEDCDGYSIATPFLDPEEMMRKAVNLDNPFYIKNAKNYCEKIKKVFGHFYEEMGVDLDAVMRLETSVKI